MKICSNFQAFLVLIMINFMKYKTIRKKSGRKGEKIEKYIVLCEIGENYFYLSYFSYYILVAWNKKIWLRKISIAKNNEILK